METEHAFALKDFNCVLVYEFQTHFSNLLDVSHIGVVKEFEDLCDALRISVGGFLHKGLRGFPKLDFGIIHTVLVCRLN